MAEKKGSSKTPDKAPKAPVRATYEKPTISKFKLEEIALIAASAAVDSGMGMCKYTFS